MKLAASDFNIVEYLIFEKTPKRQINMEVNLFTKEILFLVKLRGEDHEEMIVRLYRTLGEAVEGFNELSENNT